MRVITGCARGVRLQTPSGERTRPTAERVKEGLFSAIQFEIEGRRVLDLFAGTGQLGIEALSRGAASAVFVDSGEDAVRLIRENLDRSKLTDRAKVIRSDYLSFLDACRQTFDLVFLDPPYFEVYLENALIKISEIDILSDSGIIVCEKPTEKEISCELSRLMRGREYRYGKTSVAIFRKNCE